MIGVTITETELREHGACPGGLARFLVDFPDGLYVAECANLDGASLVNAGLVPDGWDRVDGYLTRRLA